MPDSPLTEALARWDEAPYDIQIVPEGAGPLILIAARKWADLEAQVADGARVVVAKRCKHGEFGGHSYALPWFDCPGGGARVILGEGT